MSSSPQNAKHDEAVARYLAEKAARIAEIKRSLKILHGDRLFEVRALNIPGRGKPHIASGYFKNIDVAAEAIFLLDRELPGGVYSLVNQCNPALYGRSPDRLTHYLDPTTSDVEIVHRHHLYIDCDAGNLPGVPSSEEELQCAQDLAYSTEEFLRGYGFGEPLTGTSGNGYMLLYRIDLPNTDESRDLIVALLHALQAKVEPLYYDPSKPHAKLDMKVYNAARIMRLSGTMNRRGHSTPDRPHRMCSWGELPDVWEIVPKEHLEVVAALAPKPEDQSAKSTSRNGKAGQSAQYSRLLVDRYLADHGIKFHAKQKGNATHYILERCPFNAAHGGRGESAIVQNHNGLVTYHCMHDGCEGKRWADVRDAYGLPDPESHYDPPLRSHAKKKKYEGNGQSSGGQQTNGQQADGQQAGNQAETQEDVQPLPFVASLLTSAEFDAAAYRQEFLIKDVLVAEQPCVIGGRSKVCKTGVAVDLVVSLGSGTPFLGHFATKPCRVAFWSGESGAATLQGKARRCAEARGVALADCSVFWAFDLPKLGRGDHLAAMAGLVQAHSLDVIVVDPLYLSLLEGDESGKPSDLFFMGSKLLPLSELGQATGCTIVLLHHFRKSNAGNHDDEQVALEELSQSGVAEWARQWLLLARRSAFQHDGRHELWMRCGGSAGHAGLYGVSIDEGTVDENFDGRRWEVEVQPGHEIIAATRTQRKSARDEAKREKEEADQRAVVDALSKLPRGEGAFPARLRALTGIANERLRRAIELLIGQGVVEPCSALQSPTHRTPKEGAYRLTDDWWSDV